MPDKPPEKISRISLEDAKTRKDLVFVDTRGAASIARNPVRVSGAVPLPVKDLEQGLKRLPRHRTLVTYCT